MARTRTRPIPGLWPALGRAHLAGAVAQLGERLVRNEEVRGSTPLGSTSRKRRQNGPLLRFRGSRAGRVLGQLVLQLVLFGWFCPASFVLSPGNGSVLVYRPASGLMAYDTPPLLTSS